MTRFVFDCVGLFVALFVLLLLNSGVLLHLHQSWLEIARSCLLTVYFHDHLNKKQNVKEKIVATSIASFVFSCARTDSTCVSNLCPWVGIQKMMRVLTSYVYICISLFLNSHCSFNDRMPHLPPFSPSSDNIILR
jgi:hypothetical protein